MCITEDIIIQHLNFLSADIFISLIAKNIGTQVETHFNLDVGTCGEKEGQRARVSSSIK